MITAELITRWVLLNIYDNTDNFSVVLGGRIDNHNRLGILLRQDCMCDTILGRKEFCDFQQEEGNEALMFLPKINSF
jgi:hypothetical protein